MTIANTDKEKTHEINILIDKLIGEKGISQTKFAELMGLKQGTISDKLKSHRTFNIDQLKKHPKYWLYL